MPRVTHDVLVMGTGLASLCLTRLLQLRVPGARVLTLDKAAGPARKVGESTVEIGAMFLDRRLELGPELRRTQLPKSGPRFWFDDAEHSVPLALASEDGPMTFGYWQTFQLERDRLEDTICRLNREAGAEHVFGAERIRIDGLEGGGPARASWREGGRTRRAEAPWLVDATGAASHLGRRAGLLEREERVPHGACWARFEGWKSPSAHLAEQRDRRPIIAERLLSTNHLMNDGYWIWWIPLASGLMSVGVVYDRTLLRRPPRTLEEMVTFLGRHRMCRELMEGARPVDFGQLARFAARPRAYFREDRRAWIGMAAGFVDPFYSSGTDFIALESECLTELVRRDRSGEPPEPERVRAYNDLVAAFYEQNIGFVSGVYPTFASHELRVPFYRRDIHIYWNAYAWPYFAGHFTDPDFIRRWLPVAREGHRRSGFFTRVAREAARILAERGELRRSNRGAYAFNQLGYRTFPYLNFERQMGHPVDLERTLRLMEESDAGTLLAYADVLWDGDRSPLRRLLFEAAHGETFRAALELEERTGPGEALWAGFFERFSRSLAAVLARYGVEIEPPQVTPASFGRLLPDLESRARPADRARVRELYVATPQLEKLDHLEHLGRKIQPDREAWTFEHTPWKIGKLDWQTVYDFMARNPQFAAARHY